MKTITKNRCAEICSHWHGGQNSALYQFCSSKVFLPENILHYLKELQECREPEYYLHPGTINKKNDAELKSCQRYFVKEAQNSGIEIRWYRHSIYGYLIPEVATNENSIKINGLTFLI